LNVTPREYSCNIFNFLLTFLLTSFLLFSPRDAEEKKEEKKKKKKKKKTKKRKTSQTTLGPDPAFTATPATPPRTTGEEEDRASVDAPSTAGAAPAPGTTEPLSTGVICLKRIYNF
jgi:hypothetical protein